MSKENFSDIEKIVVIDTDVPYEQNNMFFDKRLNAPNRFLWPWTYLKAQCEKAGIRMMTSDTYLSLVNKPRRALLMSVHMVGKNTSALIRSGLHPAIIFGFENPLYACRFYFNLRRFTQDFDHAYVWSGARERLAPRTIFHDAAFRPHAYPLNFRVEANFINRKFLATISRNNQLHKARRLYVRIANLFRPFPTLVNRELYLDRLKAIRFFSENPEFDLYGEWWDRPVRYESGVDPRITRCYRGYTIDKLATLQNYKFSICFENTIFGGYVTEKIMDCFFAGAIPVYYGAPDVAKYIPAELFIDFRKFRSYTELDNYLKGINEKTYNAYITKINRFISSGGYYPFSQEKFAKEIIEIVNGYYL